MDSSGQSNNSLLFVPCPRCKARTLFSSENPFRPFCSETCKTVDLGQWAREDYRIPIEGPLPINENQQDSDDENGSQG